VKVNSVNFLRRAIFDIGHEVCKFFKCYKLINITGLYDSAKWVKTKPKVAIFGSSYALLHMSPQAFCQLNPEYNHNEVVNLGLKSATPYQMYISFKNNKEKFKDCEYIFIGLDPHILGEKFNIFTLAEILLLNSSQWEYLFTKQKSFMQKYHKDITPSNLSLYGFIKKILTTKRNKSGQLNGYKPEAPQEYHITKVEKIKKHLYGDLDIFPVSTFSIEYLKKLQELINKESKAKIIYLLTPKSSWGDGYEKFCEEYDASLIHLLQSSLGEIRVSGSLFKSDFNLKSYDFFDSDHLAHSGAIKYSKSIFSNFKEIKKAPINSLYSYRMKSKPLYQHNLFLEYLKLFKRDLNSFLANKSNLVIYGFTNISRMLCTLIENKDINLTICDNNHFLKTESSFLSDTFILKKSFIHLDNLKDIEYDSLIISDLSRHNQYLTMLKHKGLDENRCFMQTNKEIDYEYLRLQINMLFSMSSYIFKRYDKFYIIGESILIDFLDEILDKRVEHLKYELHGTLTLDKDGLYIILDESHTQTIEESLIDNNIDKENILIIDL
jgi:hypothetical protein